MLAAFLTLALTQSSPRLLEIGVLARGEIDAESESVHSAILPTEAPGLRGEVFRLVAAEGGTHRIELRSYAFDAYLVLSDAAGTTLAEDDDSLVFSQARIVHDLEAGVEYTVEACSFDGASGEFELLLERGAPLEQGPRERARAEREDLARWLEAAEAKHGARHAETARSINAMAILLYRQGDYAGSLAHSERALDIQLEVLGEDHADVAGTLNGIGAALQSMGRLEEALPVSERAVDAHLAAFGREHEDTAMAMNNLGTLLQALGDYEAALSVLEEALILRELTSGPDHALVGLSCNNLGSLLKGLGRNDEARPLYERALAIQERTIGPDDPFTAITLNNLGSLLRAQGDSAGAEELFARAMLVFEARLGPDHPHTGRAVGNYAGCLQDRGALDEARPLFERALAVWERQAPDHPDTATSLNNLANLLSDEGEQERARALYERALAITERAYGSEHPATATCQSNLGSLAQSRGDYDTALRYLQRAHATSEALLGPAHPNTIHSAMAEARVLAELGDAANAFGRLHARSRERRERAWTLLASLSESERFLFLASSFDLLELQLSTADDAAARAAAYELVLDWKGLGLRVLLATREQMLAGMTAEQRELVAALQDCQSSLSDHALQTSIPDRARYRRRLQTLREERNRLELELHRSGAVPERPRSTLAGLRRRLPKGSASVDFLVHREYQFGGGKWSAPVLTVWITRADGSGAERIRLGDSAHVESTLRRYLTELTADGTAASREPSDSARALRELLWDPIAPHLDGIELVLVSPDSYLGTLPFEVLRLEDGSYAIEHRAFVYVQDLASLPEARSPAHLDSLLVVGEVDFDSRADAEPGPAVPMASSRTRGTESLRWGALPATAREARLVLQMHATAFGAEARRTSLSGREATEERIKRKAAEHAVLHLATHGYFHTADRPSPWQDRLRTEAAGAPGSEVDQLVGRHPGLMSGVVCSGANAFQSGRDDGYLTAEEVGWLDLAAVELVVLSACQTGLGEPRSGQGLIGLRRAFRAAGVDTVVSSLWAVEDTPTAQLMERFYEQLLVGGAGRIGALRNAQLEMLAERHAPAVWGGFVLSGDWR